MVFFIIFVLIAAGVLLVVAVEVWLAARNLPPAYVNPAPELQRFGTNGTKLKYLVLGDSTAAGAGAAYRDGIAVGSAQRLAKNYRVELVNAAVSGAKAVDIETTQLGRLAEFKPDLVLIAVGANDVTRLSSPQMVKARLQSLCERLVEANRNIKIVITGAPDMGSIPRFAQPLRALAGLRTKQINQLLYPWITRAGFTLAPIARDTGPAFREDPSLFCDDRFHPNGRGYALWLKTINPALDHALEAQKAK